MTQKAKLAVMISGNGSNLQALIDACESGLLLAEIVGVISSRAKAYGLTRAENYGIPTAIFRPGGSRADYDAKLGEFVAGLEADWVILAGWMRILSMNFLRHFPNRVVNLHPALPGQFAGLHAVERAFDAAQRKEIDHTGVMIHLVPDEGVDDGPVLATESVEILADDTLERLTNRIHAVEHRLLIDVICKLVNREPVPA